MAIVTAKPRNGKPRTLAIISAECALSMGSRKMRCMSDAAFDRKAALIPAMQSPRAPAANRRERRNCPVPRLTGAAVDTLISLDLASFQHLFHVQIRDQVSKIVSRVVFKQPEMPLPGSGRFRVAQPV